MAQVAKTGAENASTTSSAKPQTDNVAELRQRAVDQTAEVARTPPKGLRMQRATALRPSSGWPVRHVRRSAS